MSDRDKFRLSTHGLRRYGLAVLLVLAGAGARSLWPDVLTTTPYLVFYPAVVAAAWYGGFGPGLLATILAILCVDLVHTSPFGQFSRDGHQVARQAIFFVAGVGISVISALKLRAEQRQRHQAEALRESEGKYRVLAEHTHDWEFWVAPDGRYIYVSPAVKKLTGYPAEDFVADPLLAERIIYPADIEVYRAHRRAGDVVCVTGELEFRIIRQDGGIRWISHACIPVYDQSGTFLGIRGSNRDVTERKHAEEQLRESEMRYRTLFGSIEQGCCIIEVIFDENDKPIDYRFLEVNPSFEKQTGLASATGKTMRELSPGIEDFWIETYGSVALTGEPSRFQRRSGAMGRWFDVNALRFGSPEQRQVAILFADITERKRAEDAMADAKRSAERSKEAAEHASAAKDHFMAVLSHELRNPLTPVLATATLLQQDERLDAEARQHLEVIRRNAELEARLIDDLLDVTRITRGKVELNRQNVKLSTIIQHAVEVCQPDIAARSIHFGLDIKGGPHVVHADPGRLQQVFWNIIKNALKFTPHNGCVGVRCWSESGSAVVEVNDSGVGMEPEALTRIFNAFEQAERSITRQFGGLGLGLAISKPLVEMHGGTITAASEGEGKGSTFTVRLPLVKAKAEGESAAPQPGISHERTSPLRILLVEDHGDTARIMTQVLTRQGHDVKAAGDLATSLALAKRYHFDLLLSDLGLPDGSGVELLRALRQNGHKFPAIALSGYGQDQDVRQSLEVGFSLHLTKPVELTRLLEAVSTAASSNGH